ncbi:MAG: hypothetical protein ACXWKP_19625 [Bradyrhizobium sp.]
MRQAIETAPKDGSAILLEDDASGTCDVAHWSPEAGEWVGHDGEPIKIKPSQWYPMPGDKYLLQEDEGSSNPSQAGPSAPRAYWQFAAFSILATLIAAALLGLYFDQESPLPSQDSPKTDLLTLQQQAEPNQAGPQVKRAVKSPAPKARQSLEKEQRSEVLANELADARRTIDGLNLQLRTEAAKTAELLEQEREKTAALMREAAAARQELTASTAQHGQALEEERTRSAALASEVARARAEVETQAALLRKAGEESVQLKQAAESVIPGQTLDEERARSAALASELAKARGEVETQAALLRKAGEESAKIKQAAENEIQGQGQTLEEERARSAALTRELAKARGEIETQAALLRKADEESSQLKQAAEKEIQGQGQTLGEERARSAALASELAKARGEVETQAAQMRKAGEESVQLKKVAESAGQTLEEKRARSAALMSELAKARGDVETQATQLRKAGEESVQLKQVAERAGQTLEDERARSAALASELAKARGQVETQAALLRKASEESAQLKQAAESAIAEPRQSSRQDRERTEAMTRDLESARRSLDERVTITRTANGDIPQQTKAAQAPATEQPAATEAQDNPEPTRLIARASALLGQGNIGAARIVLERAAQSGSAQASFMLAETYDPVILSAWGTYGTRGEATKAREFYAKANAGGIQEAKDRLDALR